MKRQLTGTMAALLVLMALLSGCQKVDKSVEKAEPEGTLDAGADPVALAFVFVGCNRVGWAEETDQATGKKVILPPSTANEPQLLQTFSDVAKVLNPAPAYLFLCGDIVRNEQPGGLTLKDQLDLWQGVWKGGALANSKVTTLVPFPGNHEVLKSVEFDDKQFYEVPNAAAYSTWLAWLDKNGHFPTTGNGPAAGGSDLLIGDNSKQSYSFDAPIADGRQAHFVVLNTDSHSQFACDDPACYQPPQKNVEFKGVTIAGTMTQSVPGWIALDWAVKDIGAAVANTATDVIFVLGHKPLYNEGQASDAPSTGRGTVFNCGEKKLASGLLAAMTNAGKAGKFGGYLCAHQHLFNAFKIGGESGPKLWQVIAGNGGTKLDNGDEFGFTYVQIYKSGKVTATGYGRKVPSSYYYAPSEEVAKPGSAIVLRDARP